MNDRMSVSQANVDGKAFLGMLSPKGQIVVYDFETLKDDTAFRTSLASVIGIVEYVGLQATLAIPAHDELITVLKHYRSGEAVPEEAAAVTTG